MLGPNLCSFVFIYTSVATTRKVDNKKGLSRGTALSNPPPASTAGSHSCFPSRGQQTHKHTHIRFSFYNMMVGMLGSPA